MYNIPFCQFKQYLWPLSITCPFICKNNLKNKIKDLIYQLSIGAMLNELSHTF